MRAKPSSLVNMFELSVIAIDSLGTDILCERTLRLTVLIEPISVSNEDTDWPSELTEDADRRLRSHRRFPFDRHRLSTISPQGLLQLCTSTHQNARQSNTIYQNRPVRDDGRAAGLAVSGGGVHSDSTREGHWRSSEERMSGLPQ